MPSFIHAPQVLLVGSVSAALLLAACGGGDSGTGPATGPTAAAEAQAGDFTTGDSVAAPVTATADTAAPTTDEVESLAGSDRPILEADETEVAADEPPAEPVAAAQPEPRESTQALTIDSSDRGYAKPKVAAIDLINDNTTARADLLAKFRLVVLGARTGSGKLPSFVSAIKARNPNIRLGNYVAATELPCAEGNSTYHAPAVRQANAAKFWLYKSDGRTRLQWSTEYGNCDINLSQWSRRDSSGRTWMQYKAQFDYDRWLRDVPQLEYVFSDNTFKHPRSDGDWKRIGSTQSRTNSEVVAGYHAGHQQYWSAIKAKRSSLKIMGNVDGDLSQAGLDEKLPGAYIEGAMGKSWSRENWAGWSSMMDTYRAVLRNTIAPNDVILGGFGGATEYRKVRYGLASAMMEDGWFAYVQYPGTYKAYWFDEYEAPIGTPVESAPRAAKSNGVWMRKYQNGLVLVNPTTSSKTVSVGSSYKRLKGTQVPSVNSGAAVTSVTIGAKDGLILINR